MAEAKQFASRGHEVGGAGEETADSTVVEYVEQQFQKNKDDDDGAESPMDVKPV
jgi:hypothetical protein